MGTGGDITQGVHDGFHNHNHFNYFLLDVFQRRDKNLVKVALI
jgi:hypothetical protein